MGPGSAPHHFVLRRVRGTAHTSFTNLRLFSGFPSRTLSHYDPFAYTVICTSSGAVIARNEGDDPQPGGIPWHFDNSAQRRQ
jgi:hypothetical protein